MRKITTSNVPKFQLSYTKTDFILGSTIRQAAARKSLGNEVQFQVQLVLLRSLILWTRYINQTYIRRSENIMNLF